MVASPPSWNNATIEFAQEYFNKRASTERKTNDKLRKEKFTAIKKSNESIISLNAYEADSARYWGNFNITREFLEQLWQGIEADNEICNHFFSTLLPKHDLAKDIESIGIPIALAAGQSDFDSVPLKLWENFPKPINFTVINCGNVGHWPNLENQKYFDAKIKEWATKEL